MVRPERPKLKLDLGSVHGCKAVRHRAELSVHGYNVVRRAELAGYDLGKQLGSGTMAVVRRAVRQVDGCELAAKCIRSNDEEILQFARDEYELMKTLMHPSVVRAEGIHEESCCIWILLELCQDGSLQHYVRNHGPFTEAAATPLFCQLLEGVSYLHQRRIVHRDLKPDNCLLADEAATLKITDFNSAKVIGQGEGSSAMLTDRGTHAFSAPELLLGHMWNERVDIWACGLCLYFILRGCLPWHAESNDAKQHFLAGKLPELDFGQMSEDMKDLLLRCLEVDVHARPPAMKLLFHHTLEVKTDLSEGWFDAFLGVIAKEFCCSSKQRSRHRTWKDPDSHANAYGMLCGTRQASSENSTRPKSVPPPTSLDTKGHKESPRRHSF